MRLTRQIYLLSLFTTLLSLGVALAYFSISLHALIVEQKLNSLNSQLVLRASSFQTHIRQLKEDIVLLSSDGLATEWLQGESPQLKNLLQKHYSSLLATRSPYFQVRLLSPGGRELIRVDKTQGNIEVVKSANLQDKSGRYYIAAAKQLAPNNIWLSPIDLNREFGKISLPETPTLRAASAVHTENGERLGIVVINLDLGEFFNSLKDIEALSEIWVVNQAGEFLAHPDTSLTFAQDRGHQQNLQSLHPDLASALARDSQNYTIELQEKDYIFRSLKFRYDDINSENDLELLQFYSQQQLDDFVFTELWRYLLYAFGLFIIVIGFTLVLNKRLLNSLSRLSSAINNLEAGNDADNSIQISKPNNEIDEILLAFKAMQSTIENRELLLEQSNRDLEHFAYIASHDLQEPARKICAFSDMLLEMEGENLSEEGREIAQRNIDAATRMRDIVNSILQLANIRQTGIPNDAVDLNVLVKNALEDLQTHVQQSQAKIQVGTLPTVNGHATLLGQLILNLLNNALKFSEKNTTPDISIMPCEALRPGMQGFYIEDKGIGIPEESKKKIFEPFKRLHGKSKYKGFGIGLAFCQRVIEAHGGDICVSDAKEKGSRFTVWLPQNPEQ